MILYSLSYDDGGMSRAAISARQQESAHVQGMLNVAFTRARDEVHVFHSASMDRFFKEDGTGRLGEWLAHIKRVQDRPVPRAQGSRSGRTDSEFEVDVAEELRKRGVGVTHQHPACGFFIDLMCELGDNRVGVECDGPTHFDEHGRRRVEDLERLAVLRRAGWNIVNIPYRQWLPAPGAAIQAVLDALAGWIPTDPDDEHGAGDLPAPPSDVRRVSEEADAVFRAVKDGAVEEEDVLREARDLLGRKRLTSKLRSALQAAAFQMNHSGLLVIEEGQYFLTIAGRATTTVAQPAPAALPRRRVSKSQASGRRKTSPSTGSCVCGGRWVPRTGRYGKFYGCSRYPSCTRTRNYR